MKILVLSDTHGVVEPFINELPKHKDADLILHMGDMVADAKYIKSVTDIPLEYIQGNNENFYDKTPVHKVLELEGHRILMTHGHKEDVYFGVEKLYYRAKEYNADIAIYGHSHVYHFETIDDITFLNPGSVGHDRGGEYESYAVLYLEKDKIEVERIKL